MTLSVLNAFRHHCLRHILSCPQPIHTLRAQRLSASLLTSHYKPAVLYHGPGWCSTPFGITAYVTFEDVDNWLQPHKCSTPFGITAYVTHRALPQERPRHLVLNAFRHHCLRHTAHIGEFFAVSRCSTPFGITAYVTIGTVSRWWSIIPCSTPFGITAYVTHVSRPALPCLSVLNAFRHHCLRHNDFETVRGFPQCGVLNAFRHHCLRHSHLRAPHSQAGGAQRLSASLLTSPDELDCTEPNTLCSTPFGITAYVTRRTCDLRWRSHLCSTPFGITAYVT